MKIGPDKDENRDDKKLPSPDDNTLKIVISAEQHDNPKMLTEKHNNEKLVVTLLIVGAGLIPYHFW